ncbi:MAG TPA: extracellular solute-binding protein [Burkholderiales bacterium]|nr:extracellular solute-binding protein [Burkholderiales bacterium]
MLKKAKMGVALTAAAAAFALAFGLQAQAQPSGGKTQLTVYTSLQKEVLAAYEDAFRKQYPDIQIGWVRDAGGVIHARLLAERANPRADVIFGLPVTDILALEKEGLIERYAPKGYESLKPKFKDRNNPPIWTGIDMYLNVICFNTVEAQKRGLPKPEHWSDLAKPIYKGQIAMPNPAASNTGYGYVHSWLQTMGEQAGWKFMDALHENVGVYTNSSATPCKYAATGEYAIGLSTDLTAPMLKTKGAPIEMVIPVDKTAWDVESKAMVKNSKNPEAAKKLLDWGTSRAANEEFIKFIGSVGLPDLKNSPPPNSLVGGDAMAADLDLQWSIDNRTRIINEWSKRYSSKSEPKAK